MSDSPRPVLVGIDGTESGLEALALGSAFAVVTGAPLLLGAVYGFAAGHLWPPADAAEQWLQEAQERVGSGIAWRARSLQSTSPANGLVTLAQLEDAQLIVLGSNRDGPVGRVLAGSTARKVAHGAPCAVAVAPHDWRPQPPEVPLTFGVGLDDSAESRDALALMARFAAATHAPLKVYTAVHVPPPAHPMFATTSYERWRRDALEHAEDAAHEALAALAPGVEAEVIVAEGDPVEQLAGASRELDVLAVGSRRYGPLRSALLGSVSSRLIERAHSPVVIVPRGVHAETAAAEALEAGAHA